VALGGVLLIIKWTYDYPLIRLVASVALFFGAIYLMRVLGKLGLAFFVVALVVIYAQTFPSMTSQSEILVRLLLWLWVVINLAIVVTLLVNAGFSRLFPVISSKRGWWFCSARWRRFSPDRMPALRRRSKKLPDSSPSFSLCISRRPAPAPR
jgi:uncharacterized membrane protein YccC